MRIFKLTSLALLALSLTVTTVDALADDAPAEDAYAQIEMGNIGEFNPTWTKAKDIQETITKWETQLNKLQDDTKQAAGIATDAPVQKAFDDMKETAGEMLTVAIDGGQPKLTVDDAAPENVKAFVATVDSGVGTCQGIIDNAKEIPGEIEALIEEAKGLPSQLTPSILKDNGLKAKDLKGEKATIANNTNALKATKPRVEGVIETAVEFVNLVKGLTPAG